MNRICYYVVLCGLLWVTAPMVFIVHAKMAASMQMPDTYFEQRQPLELQEEAWPREFPWPGPLSRKPGPLFSLAAGDRSKQSAPGE
ncbi:hypothetical protein [Acidicapsa acidisoli]|uniref:hypothetical protein n=1 Tax=Acidicapsa acidisoli TaxID=1615681 RepID=UPI0021E0D3EF|nr:hypothetical protein [Acidicapsa acidisoli]